MRTPWHDQPFQRVYEQALNRLSDDQRAGGDRAGVAREWGPQLKQHIPEPRETGSPCRECSEPWPCNTVVYVLSPD